MKFTASVVLWLCLSGISYAQTTAAPSTSPAAPATPTIVPSTGTNTQRPASGGRRTVFLSGTVVTGDGSSLPEGISIQRICNGVMHTVAYTDSQGRFSFQWGQQTNSIIGDASEGNSGRRGLSSSTPGLGGDTSLRTISMDPVGSSMEGCELRASASGFRSDSLSLYNRSSMDTPDVGRIVLHRIAGGGGASVSVTSLMAPKNAKKAFERGLQELQQNRKDDAAKDFAKAVDEYPRYAEAWLNLGKVRVLQGSFEAAREALRRALDADPKMVGSLIELGLLAAEEKKWEDCAGFLDRALRLNPIDFPKAWYTAAVASFNLTQYEQAEKNVREAIRLDPRHENPRADYLLGIVLVKKHDYAGAASEFRTYVQLAPNDPETAGVKVQVAQLEKLVRENNP